MAYKSKSNTSEIAHQEVLDPARQRTISHDLSQLVSPNQTDSPARIEADIKAVTTLLRRVVKPEAVDRWLNTEIPILGGQTPVDMIRQGETEKVMEVLARIEEGIYV